MTIDEVLCGQFTGHMECEAFPAVFVEEREDAQLPAIVGPVRDKVPAPDVVEPLGAGGDSAGGTTPATGPSHPSLHTQPTLPPDALHEFSAHVPTVPAQGPGEFAIAKPRVFARQRFHLLVQREHRCIFHSFRGHT